ncbi:unnamed protein product [Amoebophrya sp. A120]|nr:unnamed protein product [Amoebophrya sp. A120]|eukprot:GSA120T00020108001.1
MVNCCDCSKPITGTYYETESGGKQCQACAEKEAGYCVACKKSMLEGDGGVTLGDIHVHSSCFKCISCTKPITGGFLEKKKLLDKADTAAIAACKPTDWFCADCGQKFQRAEWEKKHPQAAKQAPAGKPGVCTFCNEPLGSGEQIGRLGDGSQFHSRCFKCSTCGDPIKGQFVKGSKGITCMKCVPKCAGCGQNLSGQIMQAGGKSYHKVGPDGHCCFKCTHCNQAMDNGFFPDPGDETRYVCEPCYAEITENIANAKHDEERQKQIRATDEIERGHACVWSDAYRGRPEDTLYLFDEADKTELAKDPKHCCVFLDSDENMHVGKAHDIRHSINLEYLVEACKMIHLNNGQDPVFSLDPADPHDLGGKQQKKRFIPDEMCNGPLGEVMFQADYFLKKFSFGDAPVEGVKFESLFATDHSSTGARQWFVIQDGNVTISQDRVFIVDVKMIVDARRLEMGPEGYRDAPLTEPDDPALLHAHHFSENMETLRKKVPSVHELFECAKAMTLAKYLIKKRKLNINVEKILNYLPRPILEEINAVKKTTAHTEKGREPMSEYPRLIPTLRKETKHTSVHHKEKGDGIEVEEHTQSMYGGVDLGVPVEKIVVKEEPLPVADPQHPPHPFPVLKPRGAPADDQVPKWVLQNSMSRDDYIHAAKAAHPSHNMPSKRIAESKRSSAGEAAAPGEEEDEAFVDDEPYVDTHILEDKKSVVTDRASGGAAKSASQTPGSSRTTAAPPAASQPRGSAAQRMAASTGSRESGVTGSNDRAGGSTLSSAGRGAGGAPARAAPSGTTTERQSAAAAEQHRATGATTATRGSAGTTGAEQRQPSTATAVRAAGSTGSRAASARLQDHDTVGPSPVRTTAGSASGSQPRKAPSTASAGKEAASFRPPSRSAGASGAAPARKRTSVAGGSIKEEEDKGFFGGLFG